MKTAPRRYVIIGSGVAGIAAVQAIRAQDAAGEITVISDDPFGFYSRPGLAYYLTGELEENLLFPITHQEFRAYNLRWVQGRAGRILPAEHRVELENRASLPYDRLLLATGSLASALPIEGAAGCQGVHKLDNLADARAILASARRARAAVVVGGGITALELVEALLAQGLQVHFFLRGERYWNNVLDETESQIVERRLQHEGVRLHYKTELADVLAHKGRVAGVVTKDGRRIACEILAFAIGVKPRMELAKAAGLKVDRGVLADEHLQTSDPDIFAAGDVAQVYDPFSGKSALDTLWGTAREQGHCAGMNMAGHSAAYAKRVPLNVTRLAGLTTTIIGTVGSGPDPSLLGIARGDSETWRQLGLSVTAENTFEVNRLRLLVGEKHLLGAVVMGDQKLSKPLQELINQRVDITPIRAALFQTPKLGDMVAAFWTQWREREHAGEKS